ncbi:MAG: hypothetical protein CPSOU_4940 [uncultured Paraburkholderia sp.]|nr:MAG: hypothetical protein CPSOU_4940 [uncultured Paraburkholderia sp.]
MDTASLLGIQADISPGLREILTEEITEDNADALITKNFGDVSLTAFLSVTYLAHWYGVAYDEMNSLLILLGTSGNITPSVQYYQNDQLIALLESDGALDAMLITRTSGDNVRQLNYAELISLGDNKFQFNYNFSDERDNPVFAIGTKGFNSDDLLPQKKFTPRKNTPYSTTFSLSDQQLSRPVEIGMSRTTNGEGVYSSFCFKQSVFPIGVFLLKLNKLVRLHKATGMTPSAIRSVIESSNSNLEITKDVLSQLFRVNYFYAALRD